MIVVVVVLGAAVAVLGLLVIGLLRSHAEILKRLHDLGAGIESEPTSTVGSQPSMPANPQPGRDFQVMPQMPSPPEREGFGGAADLAGTGPGTGEAVTLRVTGVGHDTIVAFLSSGCVTCQRFWEAFRKPRKLALPPGTRLVVVTKGADAESESAVAKLAPSGVTTIMSTQAFTDYDVPGSPYFVQVHGPSGKVRGEGTGPDWDQVRSMLSQATDDAELAGRLAGSNVAKPDADAAREARIDRELFEAGVEPGDPSLYAVVGDDPESGPAHDGEADPR
ncbi:MAG: hypothetical protein KDB02_01560 [Acidimicrobiales bacterium]|nr:hypothetical protein [Acidimicrobiales bacterium]